MHLNAKVGFKRAVVLAAGAAMVTFAFALRATAQTVTASPIYDQSSNFPTNLPGIKTFAAPPAGFDPIAATDNQLATYGFPPRPNAQADAEHYSMWKSAVAAANHRWSGAIQLTRYQSRPFHSAPAISAGSAPSARPSGPTLGYSYNWSGYINTNNLTRWNSRDSFYLVMSDFNVPTAQQAFVANGFETGNICDGDIDLQVSWNGIDGYSDQNALLQGGTLSGYACDLPEFGTGSVYFAWIEWAPAYPVIEIFPVNPGDDFYVATWATTPTRGYVFLDDLTTQTYGTFCITSNGGPGLIGNSAEYIVERPAGDSTRLGLYPLANYVQDFWAANWAYTYDQYRHNRPPTAYPGSNSSSNMVSYMVDDSGSYVISYPQAEGSYGIFFQDYACAMVGGCTP